MEEGAWTLTVRRATATDVPDLVALWREMWDFHAALDPRYALSPLAERVMTSWMEENVRAPRSCVLLAESGPPVGYVTGMILENPPVLPWQFFGFVSEIAVTAAARRRGVGERLLRDLHAWFRSHRLPYVEVNVSVRNAVSRSFWRKNGYGEFLERLRMEL